MDFFVDEYKKNNISDTAAIQSCIFACSKVGGRVIFSKDTTYRCGMIEILSNVELHFENNARLKASDNINDFGASNMKSIDKPTWENCDYNGLPTQYFLYAKSKENIKITGDGFIDGNEEIFYGKISQYHIEGSYYPRVPLIYFEDIKNLEITGVTLTHSGFWTTHLVGCKYVEIHHINIENNLKLANCDGIDPDHCKYVKIHDCNIKSADDCIVLKTTSAAKCYGDLHDIEVYNCNLTSTSAAIKFGTESTCGFYNVYFHDCNITNSNRGISLQMRDEGYIKNICFENINIDTRCFSPNEWWGKAEPIAITCVKRNDNTNLGSIENINFKNIKMNSENGILVYSENNKISNVTFTNCDIKINKKSKWDSAYHDLRPYHLEGIFKSSITPIYINNSNNIVIESFKYNIDNSIKDSLNDYYINNSTVIKK